MFRAFTATAIIQDTLGIGVDFNQEKITKGDFLPGTTCSTEN
jgi:hypothetical protein